MTTQKTNEEPKTKIKLSKITNKMKNVLTETKFHLRKRLTPFIAITALAVSPMAQTANIENNMFTNYPATKDFIRKLDTLIATTDSSAMNMKQKLNEIMENNKENKIFCNLVEATIFSLVEYGQHLKIYVNKDEIIFFDTASQKDMKKYLEITPEKDEITGIKIYDRMNNISNEHKITSYTSIENLEIIKKELNKFFNDVLLLGKIYKEIGKKLDGE